MMQISSPFNPSSPQAQAIADLFIQSLILSAVIFSIVTGLILYAIVRYRRRPGMGDPRPEFGQRKLEIIWTAIPTLIVIALFSLTVKTMRAVEPPAGKQPSDLVVIGHQWWWEVHYPQSGIITANEIHMPVGQKWLIRLESADVIHDFWVPQLGRKMDMIPSHPNYIWIEVNEPGIYSGACSEFCGVQHAWMRLRVFAEPQAEFEAWQRRQLQIPPTPTSGDAAQGAKLFQELTCVNCHVIAGTPANARFAPDLTHLASRQTLGAGVLENTPDNLAAWLANPQAIKSGSHMPNLHLTEREVQVLVAYLETLQ